MGLPEVLRLLNKHYSKDLEVVKTLPLYFVCKMIVNAKKKEAEEQAYPLWLVHVLTSVLNKQEIVSIEEMFGFGKVDTKERTAEEITKDMLKVVENHRKRGENNS